MRVDTLNSLEGDLKGYDCPKCRNRGFLSRLRSKEEGGGLVTQECSCMPIRRTFSREEGSGLRGLLKGCTFEAFRAESPWQKAMLDMARDYAETGEGWLVMLGQSGAGKTHLCTAVCGKLMERGKRVVYSSWRDDSMRIKQADAAQREAMVRQRKEAQLLYIDDLFKTGRAGDGSVMPSGADIALAFEILNARYVGRLPTLISSEYHMDELLDIDEALGSRIREMGGEHLCMIRRERSRNYRLRNLKQL